MASNRAWTEKRSIDASVCCRLDGFACNGRAHQQIVLVYAWLLDHEADASVVIARWVEDVQDDWPVWWSSLVFRHSRTIVVVRWNISVVRRVASMADTFDWKACHFAFVDRDPIYESNDSCRDVGHWCMPRLTVKTTHEMETSTRSKIIGHHSIIVVVVGIKPVVIAETSNAVWIHSVVPSLEIILNTRLAHVR